MSDPQSANLSVGWIGTGPAGAPMVIRLAEAGCNVSAWDQTRTKTEGLIQAGVTVVDTPDQLASLDVIFTTVTSELKLEAFVAWLLATAPPAPRFLVDCSTVTAAASQRARDLARRHGTQYLAAPVSGPSQAGLIPIAVSGPADAFAAVLPVLTLLGRPVRYAGEGEQARVFNLACSQVLGGVALSLIEALVMAQKAGMPRATFLDLLNESEIVWLLTHHISAALVHLDHPPALTLAGLLNDLSRVVAGLRELGVPTPLATSARQRMLEAAACGRTKEDFAAALFEFQAEQSGVSLTPEEAPGDDRLRRIT